MKKENIQYISLLNVISCVAVVYLHVNSVYFEFVKERYWIISNIIHQITYFAVPIFFMISGATLLDYRERYSTQVYAMKRIKKAVIPFLVWNIIAFLYCYWDNPGRYSDFSIRDFLNAYVNTDYINIYWFFIPLFSIYLFIPFLSYIPKEHRKQAYIYFSVLIFLTNSCFPFVFSQAGLSYNFDITMVHGAGYVLFVLLGYLCSHYEWNKKSRYMLYALSILCLIIRIAGTQWASISGGKLNNTFAGYTNWTSVIYATGIFVFAKYVKLPEVVHKLTRKIGKLSEYTFGVYLLHYILLDYIVKRCNIDIRNAWYQLFSPIIYVGLCVIIIWLLKKAPILKHIVP